MRTAALLLLVVGCLVVLFQGRLPRRTNHPYGHSASDLPGAARFRCGCASSSIRVGSPPRQPWSFSEHDTPPRADASRPPLALRPPQAAKMDEPLRDSFLLNHCCRESQPSPKHPQPVSKLLNKPSHFRGQRLMLHTWQHQARQFGFARAHVQHLPAHGAN